MQSTQLPEGWQLAFDNRYQRWYYVNASLCISQWEQPSSTTPEHQSASQGPTHTSTMAGSWTGYGACVAAPASPASEASQSAAQAVKQQAAADSTASQPMQSQAAAVAAPAAPATVTPSSTPAAIEPAPQQSHTVSASTAAVGTSTSASANAHNTTVHISGQGCSSNGSSSNGSSSNGSSNKQGPWWYHDPRGRLLGPFTLQQLTAWRAHLPMDLVLLPSFNGNLLEHDVAQCNTESTLNPASAVSDRDTDNHGSGTAAAAVKGSKLSPSAGEGHGASAPAAPAVSAASLIGQADEEVAPAEASPAGSANQQPMTASKLAVGPNAAPPGASAPDAAPLQMTEALTAASGAANAPASTGWLYLADLLGDGQLLSSWQAAIEQQRHQQQQVSQSGQQQPLQAILGQEHQQQEPQYHQTATEVVQQPQQQQVQQQAAQPQPQQQHVPGQHSSRAGGSQQQSLPDSKENGAATTLLAQQQQQQPWPPKAVAPPAPVWDAWCNSFYSSHSSSNSSALPQLQQQHWHHQQQQHNTHQQQGPGQVWQLYPAQHAGQMPATAAAGPAKRLYHEASAVAGRSVSGFNKYAAAVLQGLPPDDEAVQLAQLAAANGCSLQEAIHQYSQANVRSSSTASVEAVGGSIDITKDGVNVLLTKDPHSGRLAVVAAGSNNSGGGISKPMACELYGDLLRWCNPESLEQALQKASKARKRQQLL